MNSVNQSRDGEAISGEAQGETLGGDGEVALKRVGRRMHNCLDFEMKYIFV